MGMGAEGGEKEKRAGGEGRTGWGDKVGGPISAPGRPPPRHARGGPAALCRRFVCTCIARAARVRGCVCDACVCRTDLHARGVRGVRL